MASITAMTAPPTRYALTGRFFHWSVALLMAAMFITIWCRGLTEPNTPERAFWTSAHTSCGLLVFGLTVLRLLIRTPSPEVAESPFAGLLRLAMHRVLLVVTLLVPVAGFVRMAARNRVTDFFGAAIPSPFGDNPFLYHAARALHGDAMQIIVLTLIGLHVAAVAHHFILKDDTLRRMT